MTLY
jgi:integrase